MKKFLSQIVTLFPIIGILISLCFFIYATLLYPGGTQYDATSIGYDWVKNFWCDLFDLKSIGGATSDSRKPAITSAVVLAGSLALFFIHFANAFSKDHFWKLIIKISGVLSMMFIALIFTPWHDTMISIASVFGLAVCIGVGREVLLSDERLLKIGGVICFVLLLVTNFIYVFGIGYSILPLIQKITLLSVLLWVIAAIVAIGRINTGFLKHN